jgi:hypothetical protein
VSARRARGCALPIVLAAAVLAVGCGDDEGRLPSPVGVYALDRVAYARDLLESDARPVAGTKEGADPKAGTEAAARARREAARLDIRLALEADGSFVVRFRFGKEEGSYRGAWERRDDRITLVTTDAPSGPLGTATTTVARYRSGSLWFEADAVPRPFVLRRQ